MNAFRACALTLLLITGCAGPSVLASEPMGKQLERALEEIKKDCIERGAPPFGENRPGRFETSCLMFTLKPWEPGDTPESAFAHSIKLPPPHDKPKDVYKPGMSSEAYFKALCEAEAGEWVFRRVEGVKGIRQERPNSAFPLGFQSIVYYSKEMAGFGDSKPEEAFVKPFGPYEFLEVRQEGSSGSSIDARYRKFTAGANRNSLVPSVDVDRAVANFAYTWRGLRRPNDREHAIEGAELLIFQVKPFEVLAVRRAFRRFFYDTTTREFRTPWRASCPSTDGRNMAVQLIEQVLVADR